ncbi:MAG TPA: bifunctional riboflavin kinase/FAD synthetase [Dehalococcoidales bacterium]|nr:bifunctional riboflavin kinase/FAD synthetase [Dehalococcoidales bacterium]
MQVERELAEAAPEKDMLLTIGVFDGVHLGHKHLLSQLKERARERNLMSGVITFRQHPRAVLASRDELPYLTSLEEKVRLLKDEGIDKVITLSFTSELAKLSARQFVSLLQKHLRMRGLLVGADFVLGRNREGNADALRKLGQEMGFSVDTVSQMKSKGKVVSSTAVRNALTKGDMKKVTELIGRPFSLRGEVKKGAGRGAGLGFPTANIEIDPKQLLPADGVYATRAYFDGKSYAAVTNIGKNPTFGAHSRTVETYLLDYSGDLYGQKLKIAIIDRLRGEKKFASVEELKKQMTADVKQGKEILEARAAK